MKITDGILGIFIASILLFGATTADAKIRAENITYVHGDIVLEGYLAYDDAVKGKRPGVLIVHQWMGLTDYEKMRARQIVELGYVAFAVDMYGKGIRPANASEAGALAKKYRSDRALMRARALTGLNVLKKNERVDMSRVAVMGYCFGGGVALELARSGADVIGTVSFHGSYDTPDIADAKNIKGRILVLHGADDPVTSAEQLLAFEDELRKAGVDWQLVSYGGAVHSFTQPMAGNDPSKGSAYNEKADRRSWREMERFYEEIFAK